MTIAQLLAPLLPRVTALIGGGGKTTLLLALGEELANRGSRVLLTTTTHLAWPPPRRYLQVSGQDETALHTLAQPGQLVIAGDPCGQGRMTGLAPALYSQADWDYILVEADGSRGMPLKVHRENEPCFPPDCGLTIQVAGLSALGQTAAQSVHRYPLAGLKGSEPITPALAAQLLLRGRGRSKGRQLGVLNQWDASPEQGQALQALLLEAGYPCLLCSLGKENAPCW